MDAKGVDRPVAWVGGQPGPLISALVFELAGRGYDVHLPRPLLPGEVLEPPWLTPRLHLGGVDGFDDRPPTRWDLAVVSDPAIAATLTRELVIGAGTRPSARVLLVANAADQVETALRLADSAGTPSNPQVTVAAPSRWRWVWQWVRQGRGRTTGDVTRIAAKAVLDGVREGRRYARYPGLS